MLQVGLMRSIAISSKVCKDCALFLSLVLSGLCGISILQEIRDL